MNNKYGLRKKALSVGRLARAYRKTLDNARTSGTISMRDVSRLVRLSDRLNDNAYLRRSLINNPFDDATSFILTGGRDTSPSNVLRSLSNLNKPMPKNLQRLRRIIRDINNDITNYPMGSLSMQSMPHSRKLLLQHIGDLQSFMQKVPDVQSTVARTKKQFNDTLIQLNNAVRGRNGKLKSYKQGQLIATDAAGRNYFMDKDGVFFKQLLMDPTTGKSVHKVTRLLDDGRQLRPDYSINGRQYWSDDGKRLVPGSIIQDNGRRLHVYNYADDGSQYVRRFIGDATPVKTKPQATSDSTTAAPAQSAVRPPVTSTVDTSSQSITPTVRVDTSGTRRAPAGATAGSTANSADAMYSVSGTPSNTGAFRYGAAPEPQGRPQAKVPYNPTQNITVGGTLGAQSRAATQTGAPQTAAGIAGVKGWLGRNWKHVLGYGTTGGFALHDIFQDDTIAGASPQEKRKMAQFQRAIWEAMNQRSFFQRLFNDSSSDIQRMRSILAGNSWSAEEIDKYMQLAGMQPTTAS